MKLPRILYLLSLLIVSTTTQAAPEWIWIKDGRKANVRAEFNRSVPIVDHLRSARLQAIADAASLTIRINGQVVDQVPAHGPLVDREVTSLLQKGENMLSLTAVSVNVAPAVALQLDWTDAKGKNGSLFTNSKWKTNGATAPYGSLANAPWWNLPSLTLDSLDDYTQWKRASNAAKGTDPSTFSTLPGYEVELLRSAGKEENSWVSMAFDPQGRITIGREDKLSLIHI